MRHTFLVCAQAITSIKGLHVPTYIAQCRAIDNVAGKLGQMFIMAPEKEQLRRDTDKS